MEEEREREREREWWWRQRWRWWRSTAGSHDIPRTSDFTQRTPDPENDAIFRDVIFCDVISHDIISYDVISCDVISRDGTSSSSVTSSPSPWRYPLWTPRPPRDGSANYQFVYPWVRTGPLYLLAPLRLSSPPSDDSSVVRSPRHVYSDNATNYHGANRELHRCFAVLIKDCLLRDHLATDEIDWHFIPSAVPHFGGLWETGVKSLKTHLKRAVGSHTLSRDEFVTLLCQIEAYLNSRPLSDDPNDMFALTPGHFLVDRPLVVVPEESVLAIDLNRLSRSATRECLEGAHMAFLTPWLFASPSTEE